MVGNVRDCDVQLEREKKRPDNISSVQKRHLDLFIDPGGGRGMRIGKPHSIKDEGNSFVPCTI
jgi:hypothetical protein